MSTFDTYEILRLVSWMAGFNVSDLSEDAHQDAEGMDASAAHVLSLLSTEPPNSKLQSFLMVCIFFYQPSFMEVFSFIILLCASNGLY